MLTPVAPPSLVSVAAIRHHLIVRQPWRGLFVSALIGLVGAMWVGQRFSLEVMGMVASGGFALYGMVSGTPRRWPAAAALLCIAPLGQTFLSLFRTLGGYEVNAIMAALGIGGAMFIGGTAATIIVAGIILLGSQPAPSEPIAKAEIKR